MKFFDAATSHPHLVRLFILERKGLKFEAQLLDISKLENRRLAYRKINPRGEVPALQLDDGTVITEVTAICEYLDEIAEGGTSLYGSTPEQRAVTRMWLRRIDLEILQPLIKWRQSDPELIDYYQGNRMPQAEGRHLLKVAINQGLNRLEDELDSGNKTWLCGDRFSAADVHFYGLMKLMMSRMSWVNVPGRPHVFAYFNRMSERAASQDSLTPLNGPVSL